MDGLEAIRSHLEERGWAEAYVADATAATEWRKLARKAGRLLKRPIHTYGFPFGAEFRCGAGIRDWGVDERERNARWQDMQEAMEKMVGRL